MDNIIDKNILFVHLGFSCNTHFFLAVYKYDEQIIDISGQIYNCLISEEMIKNNDQVIIFLINSNSNSKKPIIIHHIFHLNFKIMIYIIEELESIFKKLISIDRKHDVLLFLYDSNKNAYIAHEIDGSLLSYLKLFKNKNLKFRFIETITTKSIDYLK
jgi:hypothetical protein